MRPSGRIVVAALVVALSGASCAKVPEMRGKIAGLEKLLDQATRNGAKRCAPRELAMAEAHTRFATIELDQADMFRAQDHLIVAEANAQAAYDLSPPSKCSERRFVMEPVPVPEPGDKDGDGYPDDKDECPDKPENFQGFKDEDGCPDDPDTDSDGLGDARDPCELLAEDQDGYLDADGCPDVDNDLDSVLDDKDGASGACKNDPEDPDGYEDEDGCPDPDNDGDKVVDLEDDCPIIPGEVDNKGCPKKPALVVVTAKEIKITQQIHFEFGKATIRSQSFPVLDAVVSVLKENPDIKLEVQGHTDNVGSASLNKKLSQDRANSVRTYLMKKGIDGARLTAKGYGMDQPLVPNTDGKNRALNRRVQFIRTEKN
jgi:outer membrane protein OmpA-like peptidoglycan-associated protein